MSQSCPFVKQHQPKNFKFQLHTFNHFLKHQLMQFSVLSIICYELFSSLLSYPSIRHTLMFSYQSLQVHLMVHLDCSKVHTMFPHRVPQIYIQTFSNTLLDFGHPVHLFPSHLICIIITTKHNTLLNLENFALY